MTQAADERRPLRVLHVITGLGDGGAEGVLYRLVLADGRNSHAVISLTGVGKYGPLMSEAGIAVNSLGMPRGRVTVAGLRKLWQVIRASDADVVQTWMYHADLVGGVVARLAGKRGLVWGIRNASLDPRITAFNTRLVGRVSAWGSGYWPRRIVSCSSDAAVEHVRLGYNRDKMVVIPNGYDVGVFVPDALARVRLRAEWAIAPGTILVGMVARWDAQKDHQTLIGALARLRGVVGPQWRCALVGTGMTETNTELRELLARSGVGEQVRLFGPRRDIPAVMSALDLHLLSSASEGFPNVVAEAMACGTPCIVTNVGDAAFIVGDTGWVAPARAPERLAQKIETAMGALQDRPAWLARQHAARARIVSHFSLDRMVQSYAEVWHQAARE